MILKGHTDRDLSFEEKRQKALEKILVVNLVELIQSNAKNGYDLDYEISHIEALIGEFQNKTIKEVKDKNKELEEKLEKLEKELKEKEKQAEIKKLKKKIKNLITNLTNNFIKLIM